MTSSPASADVANGGESDRADAARHALQPVVPGDVPCEVTDRVRFTAVDHYRTPIDIPGHGVEPAIVPARHDDLAAGRSEPPGQL